VHDSWIILGKISQLQLQKLPSSSIAEAVAPGVVSGPTGPRVTPISPKGVQIFRLLAHPPGLVWGIKLSQTLWVRASRGQMDWVGCP
jgi:hypothetical protein